MRIRLRAGLRRILITRPPEYMIAFRGWGLREATRSSSAESARSRERLEKVAYIRFETEPGRQAQVDFGEFQVEQADGSVKKSRIFFDSSGGVWTMHGDYDYDERTYFQRSEDEGSALLMKMSRWGRIFTESMIATEN